MKLNIFHKVRIIAKSVILTLSLSFQFNAIAHGLIDGSSSISQLPATPSITEDIASLANYSGQAQAAGARLVEHGGEILTEAHGVLSDPNSTFQQRIQLITVLGEIGDASSVDVIIDAANQHVNNRYLYQNTLLSLTNFKQTDEIKKFVNQQLEEKNRDPLIQRSALAYYAKQPTDEANKWVDIYAAKGANENVRYAALYLGGVLGRDSVKAEIFDLLQTQQNNAREYYLLLGFSHVATMEEFLALVNSTSLSSSNVKKVRDFLEFRLSSTSEKNDMSSKLLNSKNKQLKQAAINHLIDKKNADVLVTNWQQGDAVLRAAIQRAGFTVNIGENGAELVEVEKDNYLQLWLYVFITLLLAGVLLYKLRKSS